MGEIAMIKKSEIVDAGKRTLQFLFPIFLVLAIWEIVARANIVPSFLFPAPSAVFERAIRLMQPPNYLFFHHAYKSMYRLAAGFGLCAGIGIPIGIAMGMRPTAYKFFTPLLSVMLPIPSIAWAPIVILWIGLGDLTCIIVVFLTGIFPVVYNVSTGVRSVSQVNIWAAQSMGAGTRDVFLKVLLPGALPYILAGLKLSAGGGWRALVAAEMLSATAYGLGYMIFEARTFFAVDTMFAGVMSLSVFGFLLERFLFGEIENRTVKKWGMLKQF